ncbi:HamA C-terminal domain-containing protein [Vannielia sp. SX4]|uniref:HamA C-terminal domain-containing protein n=1 Tax=Vannielia sp. SX4 TaxID=3463852 RepID=UPI004058B027
MALCPDFEVGNWRYKKLADHLFDWLPDAALRPNERLSMLAEPHKTLAQACRRVFDVEDPDKRGEIGEVLLHAACRQEYGTAPFVARLFYKMRSNDSVTSVDVAHVLQNADTGKLELWLGEAKLYKDIAQARYKALESIKPLWDPEFLEEMKALIGPKIDSGAGYGEELSWLFADETSLDQVIDRIVIPICIAADFDPTKGAASRDAAYIEAVKEELEKTKEYFGSSVPEGVRFAVILVPLDCKKKIENHFNAKVQSFL